MKVRNAHTGFTFIYIYIINLTHDTQIDDTLDIASIMSCIYIKIIILHIYVYTFYDIVH